MRTITVKNIPDDLYERLKKSAADSRRSMNSEVIVCIEQTIQSQRHKDTQNIIVRAQGIRSKTSSHIASDTEINKMKASGRA